MSSAWIAEPGVRAALKRYFERRAPAGEVDDLVQATLTDVLAAPGAPGDRADWNRWVYGVARHKLADCYRARPREASLARVEEAAADSAPHSARELLRWAERELPPGEHAESTLEALLEEADGEALEDFARARALPPTRLRQRVTRLRRHFRARWALQLAALGALFAIALFVWKALRPPVVPMEADITPRPAPAPSVELPKLPSPPELALKLREEAFERCAAGAWDECLERLDHARELDPAGESQPEVSSARLRAERGQLTRPMPSAKPEVPRLSPRATPPRGTSTPLPAPSGTTSETGGSSPPKRSKASGSIGSSL